MSLRPLMFMLGTLALLTSSLNHAAEIGWLKVEVLLFTQPQAKIQTPEEELLPTYPGSPNLDESARLVIPFLQDESTVTKPFTVLPNKQWDLNGIERALDKQGQYQILYHSAWIQPKLSNKLAESIQLHQFPDNAKAQDLDSNLQATLKISYSRHPHAQLDVFWSHESATSTKPPQVADWYQEAAAKLEDAPPANLSAGYRLNAASKLTLQKLQYFDHPKLGAFVKVSPYKLQKQTSQEDERQETVQNAVDFGYL